jgi:hypothetical protein
MHQLILSKLISKKKILSKTPLLKVCVCVCGGGLCPEFYMLIIKKQLSIFCLFKLIACISNFRYVWDRAQVGTTPPHTHIHTLSKVVFLKNIFFLPFWSFLALLQNNKIWISLIKFHKKLRKYHILQCRKII